MASGTQRRVKRSGNRQAIVRSVSAGTWYDLPDWVVIWLADSAGWITLVLALVAAPAALLAIVLGVHALPLEILGVPGTANGVGLAAPLAVIMQFIFLALAVRPLMARRRLGLRWLLVGTLAHLVQTIILGRPVTGMIELTAIIYLYWQLQPRFK